MSAAQWLGPRLFLGRTVIGKIEPDRERGKVAAFSFLPGAASVIGRDFASEADARDAVMRSAQSRCKAMFGAGIETTAGAVREGRALRTIARAIWRAGVWKCDRPVNAFAMFADLGKALGLKPEDAPRAATGGTAADAGSSAEPPPEPLDLIESA